MHLQVVVLCGESLHLLVFGLKVQESREWEACKEGAEEIVQSNKESICPFLAEVELEGRMLLWVLGERQC